MALFEVLHESVKVLQVETAARVIAAELFFAFHGRERVDERASVGLDGGRYLSCTAKVGGVQGIKELGRRGTGMRTVTERARTP